MKQAGATSRWGLWLLVCACSQAVAQSSATAPASQPQFSPRPKSQNTQGAQSASPMTPATVPGTVPAQAAQPASDPAVQTAAPAPATNASGPQVRTRTPLPTPEYVLHSGDTVDVTFRYTPEFNDEVVIAPDGRVTLKSTGAMRIAGLSLPELQRLIVRESADKLVNPEVTVSLKDFERPSVVVAGEVQNPGSFELRKPTTVLGAIMLAGGPKDDAALGRVVLFRKVDADTAQTYVLHLTHYDAHSLAHDDMPLQPGDMILVRHDKLSRLDRYVKLVNLGVYFNPLGPIF